MTEASQVNNCFCYCIKVQNIVSWFCDLLSKNNLFSLITTIIILEMQIIGFEKKLKRHLNEDYKYLFIYILACFFPATDKGIKSPRTLNSYFTGVIMFTTLFSGFSLFGKASLRNFTEKYLELVVIALVKFYNFFIMKRIITSYDDDNVNLMSNSMVISLFLIIYNLISYLFTDIFFSDQKYERKFILFQFIFGIINICQSPFIQE